MAKEKIAEKADMAVEEKLSALYTLQQIDSEIDRIRIVRGELPLEVQDLEDVVLGLETRLNNFNQEVADLEAAIAEKKNVMKEAAAAIKKYESQQNKVRNNREYDSLTKEIEFQNLEIQLSDKRIKEFKAAIVQKKELIEKAEEEFKEKKKDLKAKKAELDEIIAETEKEEEALLKR